jgi:hypothetical protein
VRLRSKCVESPADLIPKRICTSIVKRQKLTIRMSMRRLTRLTNAFSKKFENLWASLLLFLILSMAKVIKSKSLNQHLRSAKEAKLDEFYTQYVDIQKEVEAYLEFDPDTFRSKIVYCNCDDPFESNFFKYFAANFKKLGLRKLITTSYDGSPIAGQGTLFPEYNEGNGKRQKPKALAVSLDHVKDEDGDGAANIDDVKLFLKRNKAARSA